MLKDLHIGYLKDIILFSYKTVMIVIISQKYVILFLTKECTTVKSCTRQKVIKLHST